MPEGAPTETTSGERRSEARRFQLVHPVEVKRDRRRRGEDHEPARHDLSRPAGPGRPFSRDP